MSLALLLAIVAAEPAANTANTPPAAPACDKPVYMVVTGTTLDRTRMITYGKAIYESGLHPALGGYYVNAPAPLAVLEGSIAPNQTMLIVRFPCLANAKAFWNSKAYQQTIRPLRQNPSAGDYTVAVYAELPLRADMVGKVGTSEYRALFDASTVPQVDPADSNRP